jgi:hypothetical protein
MIPGWPYSFVAALEPGATSWCALLDAQRLGRDDDPTAVTATQVRDVVARLTAAGQHRPGDPDILIVFDAGYDICRLAWLLADLPVMLAGRVRSDRVFCFPAVARARTGRPPRHGPVFALADAGTHPAPAVATSTDTTRYGTARAETWPRCHPRLTHRGPWADHEGAPPIIEGSLIRLSVDRLPGDRNPKPVWLWISRPTLTAAETDRCWQMFLRRFDLEHTFALREADPGLDAAPGPYSRAGRPMDLADARRAHPAAAGPRPHRRPAPPLGETDHRPPPAHPRPRAARVSPPPPENGPSRQRTETLQTRSRPPERLPEPAHRTTSRGRQDPCGPGYAGATRLNLKFRFLKQTLGWTRPRIRTADQGDRWTWLIVTAHTQLRLARGLTTDLRRPWEKPVTDPARLTPARVRRGFRHLRAKTPCPASAPKPSRPGHGRPKGSKNRRIAPHPDVGKTRAAPATPEPKP